MTDNDVLHKGSSHLHTHINKSYKTKTNYYTNTSNYLLCTYHIIASKSFAYTELPAEQDHFTHC